MCSPPPFHPFSRCGGPISLFVFFFFFFFFEGGDVLPPIENLGPFKTQALQVWRPEPPSRFLWDPLAFQSPLLATFCNPLFLVAAHFWLFLQWLIVVFTSRFHGPTIFPAFSFLMVILVSSTFNSKTPFGTSEFLVCGLCPLPCHG